MKLVYFAWLRERLGVSEEDIAKPPQVDDVAGLMTWLIARGDPFAEIFDTPGVIRVAVNQDYAGPDTPLADGDEVALFPPVTGG
jgi:molybdopterin converting factor subunit 1